MKGYFAIIIFPSHRTLRKMPRRRPRSIRQAGRLMLHFRMEQDNPSVFDLYLVGDSERTVAEGHFKPAHGRIVPAYAFHPLPHLLIRARTWQARLRGSAGHSRNKPSEPCVWTNGDGLWIRGAIRGLTSPARASGTPVWATGGDTAGHDGEKVTPVQSRANRSHSCRIQKAAKELMS
jgi:hypothetical protein